MQDTAQMIAAGTQDGTPPAGAFRPDLRRRIGVFHWPGFATLFLRELRRVRKIAAMILLAPAVMALLYFACFALGLGVQRGTAAGDDVLTFLVPGLIMMSVLLRAAEVNGFSILGGKLDGVMLDQLMAPVGAREVVTAYALASTFTGLVSGLTIWLASLLVWPMPVAHPLAALGFAALGAMCMGLIGVLTGIVSDKWDHMAAWFTFIFVPLTFLSGAFAPVDAMPSPLREIAQASPIFHAVDGFRWAMLGTGEHQPPAWSALVLALAVAAFWGLAATLYARGWRMRA